MSAPQKKTSPVVWIGLGAFCIAVYFYVGEDAPAAKSSKKKKPTFAQKAADGEYLPEDYKAKFASLGEKPKEAFKPLVSRDDSKTAAVPGGIPGILAGGDGTWVYTGSIELDGRLQALLENSASGENVYVEEGEAWRQTKIVKIEEETLTLLGNDGEVVQVPILENAASRVAATTGANGVPAVPPLPAPAGGVQPMRVPGALAGPINGVAADGTVVDGMSLAPTDSGRGRGGRRRRSEGPGAQNGRPTFGVQLNNRDQDEN